MVQCFFFQAEDGIRDTSVTGVQTCALPIYFRRLGPVTHCVFMGMGEPMMNLDPVVEAARRLPDVGITHRRTTISTEIGRASCREREDNEVGAGVVRQK